MKIRVRYAPGDLRNVDVRDGRCPRLACFYPSRHTIRSPAGMSGCSSRTTDEWECGTRDRQGCPAQIRERMGSIYVKRAGAWEWKWKE